MENGFPAPRSLITQWQAINTTTWEAADTLTIKNIVSYSEYRENTQFNIRGENFQPVPRAPPFYSILSGVAPDQGNSRQSGFTEELQLQGRTTDDRFRWQAGAYLELSNPLGRAAGYNVLNLSCADYLNLRCQNGLNPALPGYSAGSITAPSWTISTRNVGLYAQGTFNITDRLGVTGGFRYTWDRTRAMSENIRILFPSPNSPLVTCSNNVRFPGSTPAIGKVVPDRTECRLELAASSQRPTWVIDVDYKPVEDVLLYAKWSRGYRQGYINPNIIALETWGPETVDTYEIGAKTNFEGFVRGYFNVAAFYNDFTDQQIPVNVLPLPGSGIAGGNVTVNAGRSVIKGVEGDASVRPFAGFTVDVAYAHLDTELKEIVFPPMDPNSPYASFIQPAVGTPLLLAPSNRVTVTGSYELPLSDRIGRITLAATYTRTDNQIAAFANPFGILPATDLLNLNASWNSVLGAPVDLSFFVTNATNEEVRLSVVNAYTSAGFESAIAGPPRMFGARLRYRFGP